MLSTEGDGEPRPWECILGMPHPGFLRVGGPPANLTKGDRRTDFFGGEMRFDSICREAWGRVLAVAPPELRLCVDEAGLELVIVDGPPPELLDALGFKDPTDLPLLCVDRSLVGFRLLSLGPESGQETHDVLMVFRSGFEGREPGSPDGLYPWLIHEVAHHFGFGSEVRQDWEKALGVAAED